MIKGLGNDVIEIDRIRRALNREAFRSRCFTETELKISKDSPAFLAGNFAVKEAVSKALGTGFGTIRPHEIEVLRETNGKPYVILSGEALKRSSLLGIKSWFVTISDTKTFAWAVVIAQSE